MTSPQIGRELARERERDLRGAAERYRMTRAAAGAAERGRQDGPAVATARPAGWLVRLVGATLRH